MAQFYSKDHLEFLLFHVLKVQELCRDDRYAVHDEEMLKMVVDSAGTFSEKRLYPYHLAMDQEEPELKDGRIEVHPEMKKLTREFAEQGWITSIFDLEEGGQQLPMTVHQAASFIMGAANYSAVVYPGLTQGAAELILQFGTEDQKETYLPNMFDGSWQGTMAMTEPDAGSSLSDMVTTATPTEEGHYLVKGQKIFISCGDHDACDNVVHLMLARIAGAPAGMKGVSLFIVPKFRPLPDGGLESNDVLVGGLYHKLGYRGAPIAHLMLGEQDDCRGYLVGEPHQGIRYMFKMMNGARIMVGMHATSIATAAYYASLEYARERKQGRIVSNKDMSLPQVPIIQHADVKRMLLFQKSIVEGSLALLLQASLYDDLSRIGEAADRERYALMLDLLTPIAKTYPSEMGILSTSAAIQVHGGYGYTRDFPVEKYFREIRIHTLHEGTTAIHGIDLLGRKVVMKGGAAVQHLLKDIMADIAAAKGLAALEDMAAQLSSAVQELQKLTMHLLAVAQKEGAEAYLADATLYLEYFSIVAVAWQWLKMNTVAELELPSADSRRKDFLESNLLTGRFYFEYELPKTAGLGKRLQSARRITIDADEKHLL